MTSPAGSFFDGLGGGFERGMDWRDRRADRAEAVRRRQQEDEERRLRLQLIGQQLERSTYDFNRRQTTDAAEDAAGMESRGEAFVPGAPQPDLTRSFAPRQMQMPGIGMAGEVARRPPRLLPEVSSDEDIVASTDRFGGVRQVGRSADVDEELRTIQMRDRIARGLQLEGPQAEAVLFGMDPAELRRWNEPAPVRNIDPLSPEGIRASVQRERQLRSVRGTGTDGGTTDSRRNLSAVNQQIDNLRPLAQAARRAVPGQRTDLTLMTQTPEQSGAFVRDSTTRAGIAERLEGRLDSLQGVEAELVGRLLGGQDAAPVRRVHMDTHGGGDAERVATMARALRRQGLSDEQILARLRAAGFDVEP